VGLDGGAQVIEDAAAHRVLESESLELAPIRRGVALLPSHSTAKSRERGSKLVFSKRLGMQVRRHPAGEEVLSTVGRTHDHFSKAFEVAIPFRDPHE
jgi:hypothetical protein